MKDVVEYLADLLCRRAEDAVREVEKLAERCGDSGSEACLLALAVLRTQAKRYTYREWLEDIGLPDHPVLRKVWRNSLKTGGSLILAALNILRELRGR